MPPGLRGLLDAFADAAAEVPDAENVSASVFGGHAYASWQGPEGHRFAFREGGEWRVHGEVDDGRDG